MTSLRTLVSCSPLLLLSLTFAGCAGSELRSNVDQVFSMARDARENGAYRCAPRELALADAHAEFAERELDQGDYFRAREHLALADRNVRAALKMSPPERCVDAKRPAPPLKRSADADGDGLLDDVDKCPVLAEDKDGFEDADGCPEPDNDRDGVADGADRCPLEPEDKDAFQDEDGCAEPDNDADGLLDAADRCPNDAEDKDGFEDSDGCPDPDNDRDGVLDPVDACPLEVGVPDNRGCPQKFEHIVVTQEKIELRQKVFFETNKAVIMPRSYDLMGEIGQALKARPTMSIRIEGHTDSRGSRTHNLTLSQARADAVRQHLVGLGVDPARLESRGYGPDQPIETNKTAAGREKNRRVEFVITQQQ